MSNKIISAILAIIMILSGFVLVQKQTTYAAETSGKFIAPIGKPDPNAILIHNAQELSDIRNNPTGSYVLANDIDLSTFNGGEWVPIEVFSGTFDGQGHVIKNLKITGEGYQNLGLFGHTSDTTIKNIGLEDTYIMITAGFDIFAGGISGSGDGLIDNCYNTGLVSVSVLVSDSINTSVPGFRVVFVAGISPTVNPTIINCYNTSSVSASIANDGDNFSASAYATGIGGSAIKCYNTGTISASSSSSNQNSWAYAGGISIYNAKNCYNTGGVSAIANKGLIEATADAGGICSRGGNISDCYSTGSVTASVLPSQNVRGYAFAGGISGSDYNSMKIGTINNCITLSNRIYSEVNGNYSGSFLVGYTSNDSLKTNNIALSGIAGNASNDANRLITLTEAKSKSTYEDLGWDFKNTWDINPSVNNGYPTLRLSNINDDNTTDNSTQDTTSNPGAILNDQLYLSFSGDNSFFTHKITDITYNTETCKVKVDIKQFVTPDEYSKLSDSEKDNLKLENVKLNITTPDNVLVPDSVSVTQTNRKDNSANVIMLPNLSSKNNNTDLSIELGDIPYGDLRLIDITFTFKPTQDSGSYDIKFNASADNADELNTIYKINYSLDPYLKPPLVLSLYGDSTIAYLNGVYSPNPIEVTANVINLEDENANDAFVRIRLPEGMSLYGTQSAEQSLGSLATNDTKQITWHVNVTSVANNINAIPIVVEVGATGVEVKPVTKYITISTSIQNNAWDWKTDSFSFSNYSGYSHLTEGMFEKLTFGMAPLVYSYIKSKSDTIGGYCYGMTSIASLMKAKELDPNHYGASITYDLKKSKVQDLVNFYHLTQFLPDIKDLFFNFSEYGIESFDESLLLEKIVNDTINIKNGGLPVSISFIWNSIEKDDKNNYKTGAHTVLAYDHGPIIETDNKPFKGHKISIYDPNEIYETNFYISNDFKNWDYDGFTEYTHEGDNSFTVLTTIEDGYLVSRKKVTCVISEINYLDIINPQTDTNRTRLKNYNRNFIEDILNSFKTVSNSSQSATINGLEATGNLDITIIPDIGITVEGDSPVSKTIVLPNEDIYTVTPSVSSNKIDSLAVFTNIMLTAQSDSATSAVFNPIGSEVSLNNNSGNYNVSLTFNEGYGVLPWFTIEASGKDSGNVSLKQVNDGVLLTGDSLSNVTINGNNRTETVTLNFNTQEKSVLLKEENNVLSAYVDENNDGTYETMISSTDTKTPPSQSNTNNINVPSPIYSDTTTMTDQYVYEETFENTPVSQETIEIEQDNTVEDAVIYGLDKNLKVGDPFVFMKGITARDDGGKGEYINNNITISGIINTYVPGEYPMIYQVVGANGNRVSKRIVITVE